MHKKITRCVAAMTSAALIATPVLAKTASGLQDLVGGSAAGGQGELEGRGFQHMETHKDEYRAHGYWWNADKKDCVHVVTYDGKYESITEATRSDCNQKKDNTGAAVAAVAGVAILGAALAAKNRDRDRSWERYQRDGQHYYRYDWGTTFKPSGTDHTVCYRRTRQCYTRGQYSRKWTLREFGY